MASNMIESVNSLQEAFNAIIQEYNPKEGEWYKHFQKTVKQLSEDEDISDQSLELLWYTRDNAVSSLKQGAPSWDEFQRNKEAFRTITQKLKNNVDSDSYQWAIKELQQLKQQGKTSKMYWALLNRVFAALAPELCITTVNEAYFAQVIYYLNQTFSLGIQMGTNWFEANQNYLAYVKENLPNELTQDPLLISIITWHIYEEIKANSEEQVPNASGEHPPQPTSDSSLNQILYGPPGTGKTYHTIDAAVHVAEPEFYAQLAQTSDEKAFRSALKEKYDELVKQQRIRFVTFHQSYGYEEFVEGVKANSESGDISYDIEPGVFSKICKDATKYSTAQPATKELNFDSCWHAFVELLSEKEILEIPMSQTSFRVIDFNAKRIFFEKSNGKKDHTLSINTLREIFNGSREYTSGLGVYYNPLVRYLKTLVEPELQPAIERKNYVLIIDEINRGNISKIFGELITLIEPSKREGESESLQLTLPYSGESFSVPNNLYLIGTMNTADRSLAMMDTALRRRFDFKEMMPDTRSLKGCEVKGIQLESLLDKLNQRIEVLYDREHTLGHAFFMPVKELADDPDEAFAKLVSVFQNKIIPLLQEYFFEDWHKIRLVLGDNQRNEELQFIEEKTLNNSTLNDLFGEQHNLNAYGDELKQYTLKDFGHNTVWTNPDAYIGIYNPKSLSEPENQEQSSEG